jgi:ubiquinone/menaquinone biosynthesis C-methylase UbiE
MSKVDFSRIAAKYESLSSIQKSAAEILLRLIEIGDNDDVLDLGCGVGNLTMKIREITKAKVMGIDPSEGMIKKAIEKSRTFDMIFKVKSAEEMDYKDCFDIIFCNSSFQWFRYPEKAVKNCYTALRKGGRIGIQAPAKRKYSPNFIDAVEKVKIDPRTKDIFAHFKEPWFFDIFSSGAASGYLGQDFYDVKIGVDYIENFKKIVKETFVQQANNQGEIELIFNRLFLVAIKIKEDAAQIFQ